MNTSTMYMPDPLSPPASIAEYLQRLQRALTGADPALVQDALYDAEEYLRSEMAEQPGKGEAEVIASIYGSYGAPDEVAEIYRDTEVKVQTALRAPSQPRPRSLPGRFFGVIAEPRTYGALFYLLLAGTTGGFYFTWVVTGISISAGLSVLIVGIPVAVLYFGSVRILSLIEGRIVEALLGQRMPRRPLYTQRGKSWLQRIGELFTDPRSWSTQLYFLLMLPLGVVYSTLAATLLVVSLVLMVSPILLVVGAGGYFVIDGVDLLRPEPWVWPLLVLVGVLMLFVTLHLARGLGQLHGQLAKHWLVKSAQYD